MMIPSSCVVPWIRCSSTVRVPSLRTRFSCIPSTTGFLPDLASLSGCTARGAERLFSRNALLVSCVITDRAVGSKRGEPAGMVKVLMRVDDIFDRLVRDELFRLLDHRDGPCVVLWTFDHDQVIAHFDQHAVMRAAGEIPDPVGHLVGLHLDGGLRNAVGRLDVGRNIGLGFGDGQIEGRLRSLFSG